MSGKGSAPRPFSVDADTFASRWDAIFGKKEGQGESQPELNSERTESDGQGPRAS